MLINFEPQKAERRIRVRGEPIENRVGENIKDKYQIRQEIKALYKPVKNEIRNRLAEFNSIWKKGDESEIFSELVFCLLTPQSKAYSCWQAVQNITENDLLINGTADQIASRLEGVRFCNNKSKYVVAAKEQFVINSKIQIRKNLTKFDSNLELREWLAENVKGLGYKEASHFLRNIGLGKNLAVLDRHILKNLLIYEVLDEIPKTLTKRKYMEIEKKMLDFSRELQIPMEHLDLLFWYKQTGKVFK